MPMPDPEAEAEAEDRIRTSWEANAAPWACAVRGGTIRSRAAATDAAVVDAVLALRPHAVLDLGCGEGWLARRLAAGDRRVVGTDAGVALLDLARAADPGGDYRLADHAAIAADPLGLLGDAAPFDAIAANFALLGRELAGTLTALRRLAAPTGALVVQTVHPWSARGDGEPYADGWRLERFAGFGEAGDNGWRPMPWYYRTLASWHADLAAAGWRVADLREPADPEGAAGGRPLSLLLTCRPAA